MSSSIQSVLFVKRYWSLQKAKEWLHIHGFKNIKVHETLKYYRFRQKSVTKKGEYRIKDNPKYKSIKFLIHLP